MSAVGCDYLLVEDFFTAGLGFDLGGAILLAKGLVGRPADLTRLAGSFYDSNKYQAVSMAPDRVDAVTGLSALGLGFALQAIGYVALLTRDESGDAGVGAAIIGAIILVAALGLTVVGGWLHRRARVLPTLVEMSHYVLDGTRMRYPRAALLPSWLEAAGHARLPDEDDLAYAQRVAGVEDLTVDVVGERTRRWTDPPLEGE